jgi:hypothetical protein
MSVEEKKVNMAQAEATLGALTAIFSGGNNGDGCVGERKARRTSEDGDGHDIHRWLGSADASRRLGSADASRRLDESSDDSFVTGYLGPDPDYLNWEGGGEYLLALTIITTIGYGVFVPVTNEGRYFTMFYALAGFCILGFAMGRTVQVIEVLVGRLVKAVRRSMCRAHALSCTCLGSKTHHLGHVVSPVLDGVLKQIHVGGTRSPSRSGSLVTTSDHNQLISDALFASLCTCFIAQHLSTTFDFLERIANEERARVQESNARSRPNESKPARIKGQAELREALRKGSWEGISGIDAMHETIDQVVAGLNADEELLSNADGDRPLEFCEPLDSATTADVEAVVRLEVVRLETLEHGATPSQAELQAADASVVLFSNADVNPESPDDTTRKASMTSTRPATLMPALDPDLLELEAMSFADLERAALEAKQELVKGQERLRRLELESVEQREASEKQREEVEEKWNKVWELVVHTALTYGWLVYMALVFKERERWDSHFDAFYWAFISATTIGFGDFSPELTKWWPSTHAYILISLTLMAIWLDHAGGYFFKAASCCGWLCKAPTHALHTPLHAIGHRLKRNAKGREEEEQRKQSRVASLEARLQSALPHVHLPASGVREELGIIRDELSEDVHWIITIVRRRVITFVRSELAQSLFALGCVTFVSGLVFMYCEYDYALEESRTYWSAYNSIIADLEAAEIARLQAENGGSVEQMASKGSVLNGSNGSNGSTYNATAAAADGLGGASAPASIAPSEGQRDIERALELLNAMGTCSAPPESEGDLSFSLQSAWLYSFYIATTIGYGDTNVRTAAGKNAAVVFSLLLMWVFGWASSAMSDAMDVPIAQSADAILAAVRRVANAHLAVAQGAVAAATSAVAAAASAVGQADTGSAVSGDEAEKLEEAEEASEAAEAAEAAEAEEADMPNFRLQVFLTMLATCVYVFIGVLVFYAVEQEEGGQQWTIGDTTWFLMITTTTIGFGDMALDYNRCGRAICCCPLPATYHPSQPTNQA